jgi:hypothetical protein
MDEQQGGNGNGALYFIVGGLVVAVGLGAFVYYGGHFKVGSNSTTTERTISAPTPAGTTTTTNSTEKTKP